MDLDGISNGGVSARLVARYDGETWSRLGAGLTKTEAIAQVSALAVFDDGGGPALYIGGGYFRAGGVDCSVAK